jgi:hypothetical protein
VAVRQIQELLVIRQILETLTILQTPVAEQVSSVH